MEIGLSTRGMPNLVWWRTFLGSTLRSYAWIPPGFTTDYREAQSQSLCYMVMEGSLFVCDCEKLYMNGL